MYRVNNVINDTFNAFLVEDAFFTKIEEYPILEKNMMSTVVPKKIMNFSTALNYKGDLSETFIHFYEQDDKFNRVRKDPKKYLNFFKRTAGIIGFDYSIHLDMPLIMQKCQMNDNLSLSYYYGHNGIKVIPNIRLGVDELNDEFLSAIPKSSIIAIGTYGFIKHKYEKVEAYYVFEYVIKRLKPKAIVVYGSIPKDIYDEFNSRVKLISYATFWDERRKTFTDKMKG